MFSTTTEHIKWELRKSGLDTEKISGNHVPERAYLEAQKFMEYVKSLRTASHLSGKYNFFLGNPSAMYSSPNQIQENNTLSQTYESSQPNRELTNSKSGSKVERSAAYTSIKQHLSQFSMQLAIIDLENAEAITQWITAISNFLKPYLEEQPPDSFEYNKELIRAS